MRGRTIIRRDGRVTVEADGLDSAQLEQVVSLMGGVGDGIVTEAPCLPPEEAERIAEALAELVLRGRA